MSIAFLERAADRLDGIAGSDTPEGVRAASLLEHRGPLDLACTLNPKLVRTPALELLSAELERVITVPGARLIVSFSPQEGKAIDCSTPMLTTAGWSTMGDLQVGDEVFHPDGHPARVIGAFDTMQDRRCYRVTTVDGRSIVVDSEHLWTVRDRTRRQHKTPAPWETVTTEQLLARGVIAESGKRPDGSPRRAYRFMLPRQHSLVSKPVDLPIDPYVLGAWLGDGHSEGAVLTSADVEIVENIGAAGYTVTKRPTTKYGWSITRQEARTAAIAEAQRLAEGGMALREAYRRVGLPIGSNVVVTDGRVKGQYSSVPVDPSKYATRIRSFREELRLLGVFGNKHVPDLYLTASAEQRLALLQGLMDTDGTVTSNGSSSRVVFCVCNERLAQGALYLARSLGWRATIRKGVAKLNGRVVGPKWSVAFTADRTELMPFRLRRKVNKIQELKARGGELYAVSIRSIEPVESRPVRCIKVDREDGLFLAGRDLIATHNSSLARAAVLRALQYNPDRRVAIACYAESLASDSSLAVRQMIESHGSTAKDDATGQPVPDLLGLAIAPDQGAARGWKLRSHDGGVIARGVGSGMTGKPVDFLVCDDPIKDDRDASSSTIRSRLYNWWTTVSETRLSPGASVIVVATRWHELDLSGWLIANDDTGEWRVVNIPALSDGKTDDALGRPPGEWMVSARGRTVEQWEAIRRRVGERTFAALYQGRPSPLEGGVFKRVWFDTWRVDELPAGCLPPTVVVDPADNDGDGDAAGIIVATSQPSTGRVFILDDASAPMTIARWARVAMLTCVRRSAATIAYERSLSQLPKRIREAWDGLHRQARALHRTDGDVAAAVEIVMRGTDGDDVREVLEREMAEIAGDVDGILGFGPTGPRLTPIVAKGNKQFRMQLMAPMAETGRAVMVGRFPLLEHELTTWVPGQDSPDRADAYTHACALLGGAPGVASLGTASGERIPTRSTTRTAGGARIGRSTGRRR